MVLKTAASLFSEYKSRCIEESPFPWPPLVALSPGATSVASFLGVFPERVYKYTCSYVTKYIFSFFFFLHKWQHTIYVLCCTSLFLEYPGNDSTSVRKIVGFNAPPSDVWQRLETFWRFGCHNYYWHPVGRFQGWCSTSCNAQDSAPQQRLFQHQM